MKELEINKKIKPRMEKIETKIGGSRGAPPARPPKGPDSFVSTHKFTKCSRLGSWRPPYEVGAPPTGNPGSATDNYW